MRALGYILRCGGIIRVTSTKIDIDAFPSQLVKSPSLTSTGLSDHNADQRYGVIVNGKPTLTVTEACSQDYRQIPRARGAGVRPVSDG